MKKIMQLVSPLPLPEESDPEIAFPENIQQDTEALVLDQFLLTNSNNNIDMNLILTDTTSPSLIDLICDNDLNSDQNTNPHEPFPPTKLVDYSESDSNNSYTLMDLDNQNQISHVDLINNDHTALEDPTMPAFINQVQPSTSSLFDQQEQNMTRISLESLVNNAYIDSEDSWKPASSSSDSNEDETVQRIEEETSVGKRGYKKIKPLPKRLLAKQNRNAAVGKSVQPNPCVNKRCGNSCANKFTEDDRINIFENYWGLGCDKRQKDFLLSCTKEKPIGRKRANSNVRKISYEYFIS